MKNAFASKIGFLLCVIALDGCGGTLGGNPELTQGGASGPVAGTPGPVVSNPDPTGGNPDATQGTGISFALTDAPVADAKNVFISIQSLAVFKEGEDWIEIPLQNATEVDLLQLQGGLSTPLAALETLAAGTYTQTRIILSDSSPARLIGLDGQEHILKVPSGSESGLKIKQSIIVEANKKARFTIDFDLRKSLKLTGNGNGNGGKYMLKPVLRLIENVQSGSISGSGSNSSVLCLYEAGTVKDTNDSCDNALTSLSLNLSSFGLKFIPAGNYAVRFFKDGLPVKDLENITVIAGQNTEIADPP